MEMWIISYTWFVHFFRAFEENPEEGIKQCQILLEEPDLESGVRVGDVYGVMIEYYARRDRWKAVSVLSLQQVFFKLNVFRITKFQICNSIPLYMLSQFELRNTPVFENVLSKYMYKQYLFIWQIRNMKFSPFNRLMQQ